MSRLSIVIIVMANPKEKLQQWVLKLNSGFETFQCIVNVIELALDFYIRVI